MSVLALLGALFGCGILGVGMAGLSILVTHSRYRSRRASADSESDAVRAINKRLAEHRGVPFWTNQYLSELKWTTACLSCKRRGRGFLPRALWRQLHASRQAHLSRLGQAGESK